MTRFRPGHVPRFRPGHVPRLPFEREIRTDEHPQVRSDDPLAAHLAFLESAENARGHRVEIYRALVDTPRGMTGSELELVLDAEHYCFSSQIAQLRKKGLVYDSGEMREGRKGRKQTVWKATIHRTQTEGG